MNCPLTARRRRRPSGSLGYAYVEVLVAVILVATSLSPMLASLTQAVQIQDRQLQRRDLLDQTTALMEQVLSQPYAELDTEAQAIGDATVASGFSDAPATPNRRLVFLARYDLDNADADNNALTGGDAGLLWLSVRTAAGDIDLQTLLAAP